METSQIQYTFLWNKYRPVILRLMVNAENSDQQYALSNHEFKRALPKSRGSLSFTLNLHRSRAVNNIKTSPLAQALLEVLKQSKTAAELSENSAYELRLDEKFVLHVRKSPVAVTESVPSVVSADVDSASAG